MAKERGQKRHARFGLAIIGGIIALTILIFFIPDAYRRLTPSAELVAVMAKAGALDKASEVWIAGRKVGDVLSVQLRPADVDSTVRVAVRLRVPRKYMQHVRKDSEVRVTSARLIGEPAIDILPGSPDSPPAEDGDTLRVRAGGSLEGVLDRTFRVSASLDALFTDMRAIERASGNAREREIARLNRNLKSTMGEFRTLMKTMETTPLRTLSDPQFQQLLSRLSTRSTQLGAALRDAAGRAARAKSDAQPSLDRLTARADTIQAVIADLQARINAGGGGFLIRAQRDSAITKAIAETQLQLDSLIAETTRNPLRFWF